MNATSTRDRGALGIVLAMLVVVVLGGGALIVDGGRALSARRHASNTAEAAARAAVATATPAHDFDPDRARVAALHYATGAGVAAADVVVIVGVDAVEVTIVERRRAIFAALGGADVLTVRATGSARITYSG